MSAPRLDGIHHVAYRCNDAKETTEFYQKTLGARFDIAFAEDHVPSTGAYDPYMHIFLSVGHDNILAFFELPEQPKMGRDPNTPEWVQHIAFRVASLEDLHAMKDHVRGLGIDVLGPTNHGIFQSIYFFDPNGHRLEVVADTGTADEHRQLQEVAGAMLEEWSQTKRAPKHAAWLHEKARDGHD